MTTNARDEKWSEWIDWKRMNAFPAKLAGSTEVEFKAYDEPSKVISGFYARDLEWKNIIAYRYKIKEPVKCLDNAWDEPTPEEEEAWEAKEREKNKSEGIKYDTDKPAMDLIPPYMEEEIGMVLAFGAQKYAPDNWRKVSPLRSRYLAAAQRHINALKKGEQMDPESGLHHAAHAVCCLMFLGEVELEPSE